MWYHKKCFFDSFKLNSIDEIGNFETLKYADQVEIITKIDASQSSKLEKIKKATEEPPNPNSLTNFEIEYSNLNEDRCAVCVEPILRNELRIKKIVYDTDVALQFGKEILWNHYYCFVQQRDVYDFLWSGDQLPGYSELQPAHKEFIKEALP